MVTFYDTAYKVCFSAPLALLLADPAAQMKSLWESQLDSGSTTIEVQGWLVHGLLLPILCH